MLVKKCGLISIIAILMVALLAGIGLNLSINTIQTKAESSVHTGIMIPLYTYPGATWSQVIDTKATHPNVPIAVILNQNSGAGIAYDSTWNTYINKLVSANVTCYGYGGCGETNEFDNNRDTTQDVNNWKTWYPQITGIFVDGFHGGYAYSGDLQVERARINGYNVVIGNPGMSVSASELISVDVGNVYEAIGLPTITQMQSFANTYGANKVYTLVYGINSIDTSWINQVKDKYAQWLYVTNDVLDNPWDTLPPYFDTMATALDDSPFVITPTPVIITTPIITPSNNNNNKDNDYIHRNWNFEWSQNHNSYLFDRNFWKSLFGFK